MTQHPLHPRRLRRATAGLGAAAIAVTATVVGLPSGSSSAAPDAASSSGSAGASGARGADERGATALLRPSGGRASAGASAPTAPAAVEGEHELVTLQADALPSQVSPASPVVVSLPGLGSGGTGPDGRGEPTLVEISDVERAAGTTTWQGAAQGQPESSFTLVDVGTTMRGSLVTTDGIYALTPTDDGRFWWTRVDVLETADESGDMLSLPDDAADGAGAGAGGADAAGAAAPKKGKKGKKGRGKAKIGIVFGYTKEAGDAVGGKANIKAAAALVVAQTNQALVNSGVKAKLKLRGVVKTKGKSAPDSASTNVGRLYKTRDGNFDNLQRLRKRKGADLVHLLASGTRERSCGAGYAPDKPRQAQPVLGAASTYVQCLAQLSATHEIGHNLGADHNDYPGVTHGVKTKGAYGFANPAAGYVTVMSYYDPCIDANVNCSRVLFYSSPKKTYLGQPVGSGKKTNNANVIKQVAPRVARYYR